MNTKIESLEKKFNIEDVVTQEIIEKQKYSDLTVFCWNSVCAINVFYLHSYVEH